MEVKIFYLHPKSQQLDKQEVWPCLLFSDMFRDVSLRQQGTLGDISRSIHMHWREKVVPCQ